MGGISRILRRRVIRIPVADKGVKRSRSVARSERIRRSPGVLECYKYRQAQVALVDAVDYVEEAQDLGIRGRRPAGLSDPLMIRFSRDLDLPQPGLCGGLCARVEPLHLGFDPSRYVIRKIDRFEKVLLAIDHDIVGRGPIREFFGPGDKELFSPGI